MLIKALGPWNVKKAQLCIAVVREGLAPISGAQLSV